MGYPIARLRAAIACPDLATLEHAYDQQLIKLFDVLFENHIDAPNKFDTACA
jgi:hypothetical protein